MDKGFGINLRACYAALAGGRLVKNPVATNSPDDRSSSATTNPPNGPERMVSEEGTGARRGALGVYPDGGRSIWLLGMLSSRSRP